MGFPSGSVVKNPSANTGDTGSIPGLRRPPGEGNGNPLQYSCLENPMDGGSLVGYSPRGRKESDTTERLHLTSKRSLHTTARAYPLLDTTATSPCAAKKTQGGQKET